jgi:hypothetical protein
MSKEETKQIVKEVILELRSEGVHADCPFAGIETEKISAIKAMPAGAFKMVCMTWAIVNQFGALIGKGIAVGMFVIIIVLLGIGGAMLIKLGWK